MQNATHPEPAPKELADMLLEFARRQYWNSARPYDRPLWFFRLALPQMKGDLHCELMPNLALRVRDRETGEVLAQSKPGDFSKSDHRSADIAARFQLWSDGRAQVREATSAPPMQARQGLAPPRAPDARNPTQGTP